MSPTHAAIRVDANDVFFSLYRRIERSTKTRAFDAVASREIATVEAAQPIA
jgi:hypothetical protein